MDRPTKDFVKLCADKLSVQEPIYEFGSRQMPGQEVYADLRCYFAGKDYLGADYLNGPGVDVILDLHRINLPSDSIGTIICMEVLEHVEQPFQALEEIYRVLRPGGLLILSTPMKLRIHGSPYDYWRFTPQGFATLLKPFEQSFIGFCGDPYFPDKVVGIAIKQGKIALDDFLISYRSWQQRWTKRWTVVARDIVLRLKPFLPAMFTDSTFELWRRHAENKNYKKWRNFFYFFVPPALTRRYRAIKRNAK
jgi:SAM-dependent methyltransferase